jgi:hypothetical protein
LPHRSVRSTVMREWTKLTSWFCSGCSQLHLPPSHHWNISGIQNILNVNHLQLKGVECYCLRWQRSANRFRKSQIPKLADLPNLSDLLTFCKCGNFVDLRFGDPIFCGIKTSANPQKPNLSPHK